MRSPHFSRKVANLKQGDYFGENALLRNEPRSATIKAITEIKTLKITQVERFSRVLVLMSFSFWVL